MDVKTSQTKYLRDQTNTYTKIAKTPRFLSEMGNI